MAIMSLSTPTADPSSGIHHPRLKFDPISSTSPLFFSKSRPAPLLPLITPTSPTTPVNPLSPVHAVYPSSNEDRPSLIKRLSYQHPRQEPPSPQDPVQTLGLPLPLPLPPLRQSTLIRQHRHRASQGGLVFGRGRSFIFPVESNSSNGFKHSPHQGPGHNHKRAQSSQLAGTLETLLSSPMLLQGRDDPSQHQFRDYDADKASQENSKAVHDQPDQEDSAPEQDYVYTAPCEHHPSKGQTDYLVNDMFPKLEHDLSTIEFGIRIADFMPLAFKTVPVAGLAERELELLSTLTNLPNVIQLQDSFVNDAGDTVLVLPMLKPFQCMALNGSLCSVRQSFKQILTGLAAVHGRNIVHLDINPSNLMLTHPSKDIVVIDFGLSVVLDATPRAIPVCGTAGYIAPEILHQDELQDPKLADLYSLGIVLGQMLEPYIPDCDLHYFGSKHLGIDNSNQTLALLRDFVVQGACYPNVLLQAADLLCCMLEEDPKKRKGAQELLDHHPFLAPATTEANLELKDWQCRVQEIKYQKYLSQAQGGCEFLRYR